MTGRQNQHNPGEAVGDAGERRAGNGRMADLKAEVAARYITVNGAHPMTEVDDAYANAYFAPLADVAAASGTTADDLRRHVLARRLPLPSYLRSDGTELVPARLLDLANQAGGVERLGQWFQHHWRDPAEAAKEWDAYLSGQYVCLREVNPTNIQRKAELVHAIQTELSQPKPQSSEWLDGLHGLVDALDALEPPFTEYDRLRFAGPTSRQSMIDAVRAIYPRTRDRP